VPHTVASFAGSAASAAQFPRDGLPEVAFLGRSNVGKSSLLNGLAGSRVLARVSSTPGRTQLLNFFRVELGAPAPDIYFVDLPGYGYAKVPEALRRSWGALVTRYLEGREPLVLCVFIVDARHDPTEGDAVLKAYLDERGLPYVLAANKADKLGRGQVEQRRRQLEQGLGQYAEAVLPVSAATGAGLTELWKTIRQATLAAANTRN
jgi:GTP-binding protein